MDARLILKEIGSRINNIGTIVDTADYGPWTDIITSNNIGNQTVITSLEQRVTALESKV